MKKVLISLGAHKVFIECSKNTKRDKIWECARAYFQEKLDESILDMYDSSYRTEKEWSKDYIKSLDKSNSISWDNIPTLKL